MNSREGALAAIYPGGFSVFASQAGKFGFGLIDWWERIVKADQNRANHIPNLGIHSVDFGLVFVVENDLWRHELHSVVVCAGNAHDFFTTPNNNVLTLHFSLAFVFSQARIPEVM